MATVLCWFLTLLDNPKYKWWNPWQPKKTIQWTCDTKYLKINK